MGRGENFWGTMSETLWESKKEKDTIYIRLGDKSPQTVVGMDRASEKPRHLS